MNILRNLFGKEKPIASYEDFWRWFKSNSKSFHKVVKDHDDIEQAFLNKLSPKLEQLRAGFFFLAGMYDENTAELILTPDDIVKNIVFTEELIEAAPSIDGWRFTALKPAANLKYDIKMEDYSYGETTLWFYPNIHTNYPDEIDITIIHRDFNEDNGASITNGVYIFLDNFLGELTTVTTIDNVVVKGKDGSEPELIPIEKLKSYLTWREKEFIEKYKGTRHSAEGDIYSIFEATLKENNLPIISSINTTLLDWDAKASHPWILTIILKYKDGIGNGMPDEHINQLMYEIEESLLKDFKASDGYLNIGHETLDNTREIYYACKEFRKPSKVAEQVVKLHSHRFEVSYEIYKDKYWRSFTRFMK